MNDSSSSEDDCLYSQRTGLRSGTSVSVIPETNPEELEVIPETIPPSDSENKKRTREDSPTGESPLPKVSRNQQDQRKRRDNEECTIEEVEEVTPSINQKPKALTKKPESNFAGTVDDWEEVESGEEWLIEQFESIKYEKLKEIWEPWHNYRHNSAGWKKTQFFAAKEDAEFDVFSEETVTYQYYSVDDKLFHQQPKWPVNESSKARIKKVKKEKDQSGKLFSYYTNFYNI